MLPPQLNTGAEGSQWSSTAELRVLDNKSKGRTLIKAPQADAAEGMGGAQLRLSWPGLLGKDLQGRPGGGKASPCTHRGTEGLALDAATGVLSPCRALEVTPVEVPVLLENQPFVQSQPLGPGGNSQGKHLQKSGWDPQHPSPRGCQGSALCVLGDLEAAGAHRDPLGTSQSSIPGLSKRHRHIPQHTPCSTPAEEAPNPSSEPGKAGTKPERVFTHVTEAQTTE